MRAYVRFTHKKTTVICRYFTLLLLLIGGWRSPESCATEVIEDPITVTVKPAVTIETQNPPATVNETAVTTVVAGKCDEGVMLAAAATAAPEPSDLAQVEQTATTDAAGLPRLAAMLLGRNQSGDASRAIRLLEIWLRTSQPSAETRSTVQLLLLLAREREIWALTRKGTRISKVAPNIQENELTAVRKELEEARDDYETAMLEIIELRRKLKDITSIEKSMDERKAH